MSKSWYAAEGIRRVESLVFGADAESKLLFRSSWQGCSACFCNETFKQLCHEYEIEGLQFIEDLLDVGYLVE